MSSWQTIENDAGVFTQLVKDLGVEGVQFEEVPLVEHLATLNSPLYGVIFLFKYERQNYAGEAPVQGEFEQACPEGLFFAQQTIPNACATQAVLNTLLSIGNDHRNSIRLGTVLSDFLQFTAGFSDPALRGETITNSVAIRNVHNSFTSPDPFEHEEPSPSAQSSEAAFHYSGFVPYNGYIYELDGLHPRPIIHRAYGANNDDPAVFAANLAALLSARMSMVADSSFSVTAIVRDKLEHLTEQLDAPDVDDGRRFWLQDLIQDELRVRDRWAKEIALRRDGLVGLVYAVFKQMLGSMSDDEFAQRRAAAAARTNERERRRTC
ncbi:AGL316Wp [Eremothecium gossypii ATCC 10895]|uniref:Ubiquitin carboxyl-terminal hydrolase n=1 Tax=Eremothecium gossypii (strain ATCC 10895 / CBS 109.51 / FGSC 9923 / NRRL Y-1056) TaxID=284811 RepID=Q751S0_EREGS|nr:AGL316Wp [Eremothecium gossypii ATCC 10895]AAS54175.2 AGL316Wp [Eremothecium gossypii ATCC 10895]AEY98501.1 FAGL316Wp [Eremothecium gossypii FDAG1]